MKIKNLQMMLLGIQLIILVVMLFQINAVSSKVDFVTGLATGTAAIDEIELYLDEDLDGSGAVGDTPGEVIVADTPPTVAEPAVVEVSEDDDAWTGGANAKVTIIEFSDFECPYCAGGADVVHELLEEYGDDIKVVFRDFPLSFHSNAQKAAEAAECADEQDMFWEYHDVLFANQGALGIDALKSYANELGLDTEEFDSCLDSGEMAAEVAADMAEGASYGVQGTPAFFVNGQLISGAQPIENFKAVIDPLL